MKPRLRRIATTGLIVAVVVGTSALAPTAASALTPTSTYAAINHSVSHPGATIVVSGVVSPNLHGRPVYLERLTSSGWVVSRRYILTSTSHYVFSFVLGSVGSWTYRVYTSHTATTAASASRSLSLRSVACLASVSDSHPSQYSYVDVRVGAGPSASVVTTAHYRTKDTTYGTTADSAGSAVTSYYTASATLGYRVVVSVSVRWGGIRASCSTSFTPA